MRGVCKIDPIKLRTSVHLVSFIMLHLTISGKADTQMTSKKEREEEERKGGRRERGRERGRKGRTAEEGRKAAGGALQPGDNECPQFRGWHRWDLPLFPSGRRASASVDA